MSVATLSPCRVFVYGTLKRGQVRGSMWPCPATQITPATTRGELYDLQDYPALIAGTDWIEGEVWEFNEQQMPETLRVLDAIEGYAEQSDDEYVRVVVDCYVADSPLSAWAYYYADRKMLTPIRRIRPNRDGLCCWPPVGG